MDAGVAGEFLSEPDPFCHIANKRRQSGILACLINLSQFLIINEAGPVSSTVVGHSKTCLIIAFGWFHSGKSLSDGSLVGILMALGGIIA
jgi:solute carrier family 35 protein E3